MIFWFGVFILVCINFCYGIKCYEILRFLNLIDKIGLLIIWLGYCECMILKNWLVVVIRGRFVCVVIICYKGYEDVW